MTDRVCDVIVVQTGRPAPEAAGASRSQTSVPSRDADGSDETRVANSRIVNVRFIARGAPSRTRERKSRIAVSTRSAEDTCSGVSCRETNPSASPPRRRSSDSADGLHRMTDECSDAGTLDLHGGVLPLRCSSIRRCSRRSANGERQTFPRHTTRIEKSSHGSTGRSVMTRVSLVTASFVRVSWATRTLVQVKCPGERRFVLRSGDVAKLP